MSVNNNFPPIYSEKAMAWSNPGFAYQKFTYDKLFDPKIVAFINAQADELPFKQEQKNNETVQVYHRPVYSKSSTLVIDNSVNVNTRGSIEAQNKRDNQVAALMVATIVGTLFSIVSAKLYHQNNAINDNIDDLKDFKRSLPKNSANHPHLQDLHKIVKLRLSELNTAKNYVIAKSTIAVVAVVSAIFLGISALAAPELMAIGAIATGLSVLAGIFTWSLEAFSPQPEKIARTVRDLLSNLKSATTAVPYQGTSAQRCPSQAGMKDAEFAPAPM